MILRQKTLIYNIIIKMKKISLFTKKNIILKKKKMKSTFTIIISINLKVP